LYTLYLRATINLIQWHVRFSTKISKRLFVSSNNVYNQWRNYTRNQKTKVGWAHTESSAYRGPTRCTGPRYSVYKIYIYITFFRRFYVYYSYHETPAINQTPRALNSLPRRAQELRAIIRTLMETYNTDFLLLLFFYFV